MPKQVVLLVLKFNPYSIFMSMRYKYVWEELDAALSILNDNRNKACMTTSEVAILFTEPGYHYSPYDVELILQKLRIDGYSSTDVNDISALTQDRNPLDLITRNLWTITLNGRVHLENYGGYSGDRDSRLLEKKKGIKHEQYLRYGAVGAAIVSALFLLFDYLKFLYQNYPEFARNVDQIIP